MALEEPKILKPGQEYGEIQHYEKRRHLYEQALRCIDREENLIHYRMSWGLQWNLGTFATLMVLQSVDLSDNAKAALGIVFALFGIGVSAIALIAVWAAHTQSNFVIRSLCHALGVDNHEWNNEFIRPYGNHTSVHGPARWASKFIFVATIAIWLTFILSILFLGLQINFDISGQQ